MKWWQQALRSFITPYGAAKEAPEPSTIHKRLQPFTSEWLIRPNVALSEYADTVLSNIPILESRGAKMVHSSVVSKLKEHYSPIWQNLEALNNKTAQSAASTTDAKEVLKTLMNDDDMDMLMDQLFQVSGAMFALSTNYLIASSLTRHPKQFAAIVDPKSKEGSFV